MNREIFFGRNLRNIRSKQGLTQDVIAEAIYVTRQTVSMWEKGKGKPDIYSFEKLRKFLNVTYEELMYGSGGYMAYDDKTVKLEGEDNYCCIDRGYISQIKQKGFYTILQEDLQIFSPLIVLELEQILVIVLSLKRKGYYITEIFSNGFSVYLDNEFAMSFCRDIDRVINDMIHCDSEIVEADRKKIELEMGEIWDAYGNVLEHVSKEIYGAESRTFKYYWIDKNENVRGYANTKMEVEEQARQQECLMYTILDNI